MTAPRISETFRKDTLHAPGHGYGRNIGTVKTPKWVADRGINMSSEVIHTTNNAKPDTKPWSEATYIRDSPDVSCHDFIAKNGDVYVILPETMEAWHAGAALAAFTNRYSFGTEMHCSVGEKPTQAQLDSLEYRIRDRRTRYGVAKTRIDTHRAVALPKGRKSDPEGWPDAAFYKWRDGLFLPTEPDWRKEWNRADYDVVKDWGIFQRWKQEYLAGHPLGSPLTNEMLLPNGWTYQCFANGVVRWQAPDRTEVLR